MSVRQQAADAVHRLVYRPTKWRKQAGGSGIRGAEKN